MKTPSGTGGGYRRKADQNTLGRNSRIRYSSYIPHDKRMVPHGSARLFQNNNRPSGKISQPDLNVPSVSIRFELNNDGINATTTSNNWKFWLSSVSALTGTLYTVYEDIEIPDANYSVSVQIISSISKQNLEVFTRPGANPVNLDGESFIDPTHRQKYFVARRFRISFYNLDNATPVYERSTEYTPYFCYSPVVGISSPAIDASILYGNAGTVFDLSCCTSSSTASKLVTRFDNITYSGNSNTELFQLQFNAASTTASDLGLISTPVPYQATSAFDPTNNAPPRFDLELTQTGGYVTENYAVNNLYAQFEPVAWPPQVTKTLGYGWDPSWENIPISPRSLTTFDISFARFELSQGQTSTNPWKSFNIDLTALNATNVASVGPNIQGQYVIWCLRSAKSTPTAYLAVTNTYEDPAVSVPVTMHSNILRIVNSAASDDIRGPIIGYIQAQWNYTGIGVHTAVDQTVHSAVPPYFNTINLTLQNQTNDEYDIVITGFDGFTAFNQNGASGETPYWTIELLITDGSSNILFEDNSVQYDGTIPFTLKHVSRLSGSSDLSWFPLNYTGVHNISITIKYTFETSWFVIPLYLAPLSSFIVHTAQNVLTTSSFTASSPAYTSSSVSILNETSVSFDVELTSLVADPTTTFDIEFEVVRPSNPNNLPEKTAAIVQVPGNTTNYTIYQADRLLQDTDWWRGDPNAHTFNVIVRVKYGNFVYNTHTVPTQVFPPALIWRFKGNSSCLSDIDGHGLTWVINNPNTAITYNANDIVLSGPGVNHDIRLYNTNNSIDDKCMDIGLFRNATFGVRMQAVVTSSAAVFNLRGKDPSTVNSGPWKTRLYSLLMYTNQLSAAGHRTSGIFQNSNSSVTPPIVGGQTVIQEASATHGYNFAYNNVTSNYPQSEFAIMRTYETGITGHLRAPGTSTRFATSNFTDQFFVKDSGGGGRTPLNVVGNTTSHVYDNDNEGVGFVGGTHLIDPAGVTRSSASFGTVTGYNGVTSGSQDANYLEAVFYNSGGKLEGIYLYPHTIAIPQDLIGINQLTNSQILAQSSYAVIQGNNYDVKRAFDNNYAVGAYRDWMAYDVNELRLWAWIDLEKVRFVSKVRLWQVAAVPYNQDRVKNVKLYITNDITQATGQWQGSHFFDFSDATHRANCDLYYTNSSGVYVSYDAVNDYDDVGHEFNDPTLAITNSVSTGYWEFDFDNSYFPSSDRLGRYLYIRFDERYAGGQPRIAQAQVIGY